MSACCLPTLTLYRHDTPTTTTTITQTTPSTKPRARRLPRRRRLWRSLLRHPPTWASPNERRSSRSWWRPQRFFSFQPSRHEGDLPSFCCTLRSWF